MPCDTPKRGGASLGLLEGSDETVDTRFTFMEFPKSVRLHFVDHFSAFVYLFLVRKVDFKIKAIYVI